MLTKAVARTHVAGAGVSVVAGDGLPHAGARQAMVLAGTRVIVVARRPGRRDQDAPDGRLAGALFARTAAGALPHDAGADSIGTDVPFGAGVTVVAPLTGVRVRLDTEAFLATPDPARTGSLQE